MRFGDETDELTDFVRVVAYVYHSLTGFVCVDLEEMNIVEPGARLLAVGL